MNFDLDDEQLLFKGSVERLLANRYSFEQRAEHMRHERGYGTAIWQAFAELGLLAIPFDLDDGGLGMSPVETMIVMEAFGSALVIEPYLANVVLAGGILRRAPGGDGRAVLIAGIAEGTRTAAASCSLNTGMSLSTRLCSDAEMFSNSTAWWQMS